MPVQPVASAALHPGQCPLTGASSDLIDTEWDGWHDGRLYLSRVKAEEIGEAAGLVRPQALAGAAEQLAVAEATIAQLEAENVALRQAVEEAESLRRAIAYTLERGAVLDARKGTVGLRHLPGTSRIDLERSLWPFDEATETQAAAAGSD